VSDITGVLVTGDNLSTGDAAHLSGVDADLVRGDIRAAGTLDEVGRNFASCDRAHRLLGYSPTVRIEDGIPLLWQWFKSEVFRG
jgi:nucleoside-diphosphate-sugar epimerase